MLNSKAGVESALKSAAMYSHFAALNLKLFALHFSYNDKLYDVSISSNIFPQKGTFHSIYIQLSISEICIDSAILNKISILSNGKSLLNSFIICAE